MKASDLEEVYLTDEFEEIFKTQESFDPKSICDHDKYLEISNSGVFPVRAISSRWDRGVSHVDVHHDDGREIGQLLLLKGRVLESFYSLTSIEFLAYLADVPRDRFGELEYVFSSDYLVMTDVPAAEYDRDLRTTSDIWGGFTHHTKPSSSVIALSGITANSKIAVPSTHHLEAFARYTYAQNSFERFLRLYHCVELIFDTITVLKIKKLTSDISGLHSILSAHESKEVDRLIKISGDFIYDPESLAQKLTLVSGYESLSKTIFDEHSKHGNPIPPSANPPRWNTVITSLSSGKYTEADLRGSKALKQGENYKVFIAKIAAYWIYRVRCSIAHSRIGEFIINDFDSNFVSDFAEPLLLELCMQIFSSSELKKIL